MSVDTDGFPGTEELEGSPGWPSPERLARGPCAVIECVQEIPCNPCETVCPHRCIAVGENIVDLPRLEAEACTGCGLCVSVCPGQAIFVVDCSVGGGQAVVGFPWEFLPLPQVGQRVEAVDREGETVASGKVVRVVSTRRNDRTAVVYLAVPLGLAHLVRGMRRQAPAPAAD